MAYTFNKKKTVLCITIWTYENFIHHPNSFTSICWMNVLILSTLLHFIFFHRLHKSTVTIKNIVRVFNFHFYCKTVQLIATIYFSLRCRIIWISFSCRTLIIWVLFFLIQKRFFLIRYLVFVQRLVSLFVFSRYSA